MEKGKRKPMGTESHTTERHHSIYNTEVVHAGEGIGSIEEYMGTLDPCDDYIDVVCVLKGASYHVFSMHGELFYAKLGDGEGETQTS